MCEGCFSNVVENLRMTQETNLVICFLRGLNGSFSGIEAQIMAMDPLPNKNRVFSLLLQHEREFVVLNKEVDVDEVA